MLHGDFGYSFEYQMPVSDVVGERLWLTILVSFTTILLTWLIAFPIGIYSATHQYSWSDYGLTFLGLLGIAVPNFMAQEDVLDHYRRADLFALACRIAANGDRDGLPNVLVEASSQRLVCLSTAVSGVPELLDDGENGLVVPPEDPGRLAKALETAIRNPALRKRLGDAAERRVRDDFDYHSSIRQLTGLFEAEWQKAS